MSNRTLSNKYQSVSTPDLLAKFEEVATKRGLDFEIKNLTRKPSAKSTVHAFQVTFGSEFELFGSKVSPRVLIKNSYRGESALTIQVGLYRFVCSNGLVLGETCFKEKIIHIKGQTIEMKLAELGSRIEAALEWIDTKMKAAIEEKTAMTLSPEKAVEIVSQLKVSKRIKASVATLIENPIALRPEDRGNNVFSLWNIVNEQIRKSSRSPLREMERNERLLENILDLAA